MKLKLLALLFMPLTAFAVASENETNIDREICELRLNPRIEAVYNLVKLGLQRSAWDVEMVASLLEGEFDLGKLAGEDSAQNLLFAEAVQRVQEALRSEDEELTRKVLRILIAKENKIKAKQDFTEQTTAAILSPRFDTITDGDWNFEAQTWHRTRAGDHQLVFAGPGPSGRAITGRVFDPRSRQWSELPEVIVPMVPFSGMQHFVLHSNIAGKLLAFGVSTYAQEGNNKRTLYLSAIDYSQAGGEELRSIPLSATQIKALKMLEAKNGCVYLLLLSETVGGLELQIFQYSEHRLRPWFSLKVDSETAGLDPIVAFIRDNEPHAVVQINEYLALVHLGTRGATLIHKWENEFFKLYMRMNVDADGRDFVAVASTLKQVRYYREGVDKPVALNNEHAIHPLEWLRSKGRLFLMRHDHRQVIHIDEPFAETPTDAVALRRDNELPSFVQNADGEALLIIPDHREAGLRFHVREIENLRHAGVELDLFEILKTGVIDDGRDYHIQLSRSGPSYSLLDVLDKVRYPTFVPGAYVRLGWRRLQGGRYVTPEFSRSSGIPVFRMHSLFETVAKK